MTEQITIRDATSDDVPFVARIILMASRGHLPRGQFEWMFDLSEEECLSLLSALAVSDEVGMCHHSLFSIAEVDGAPAAALCGFDAKTQRVFMAIPQAIASAGLELTYDQAFFDRMTMMGRAIPEHAPGAWVIENMGTLPEYRRRGLSEKLLLHMLDRGRARGHDTAQIVVMLGNAPARNAYTKAGFEVVDEFRDAEIEASFGSAGFERLLRSI